MSDFVLDSYKEISNLSYFIFEVHHMNAVKSLTNGQLFSKDFLILVMLNQSSTITPSKVAKDMHYELSALSNRLRFLEEEGYIERKHSDDEKRTVNIYITKKGKLISSKYDEYIKKYITLVKKSTSIKDLVLLQGIASKLRIMLKEQRYNPNENESRGLSNLLFMHLQNYLASYEYDFISSYAQDMKQNDLFILTEFYVYFQNGNNILTEFASHIHIPYQTLNSKIKKYIEHGYITKNDKVLKLTKDIEHIVEKFMLLRISLYYKTMHLFNINEQKIINKLFLKLKVHSQSYN